jgi:hypothetical protein
VEAEASPCQTHPAHSLLAAPPRLSLGRPGECQSRSQRGRPVLHAVWTDNGPFFDQLYVCPEPGLANDRVSERKEIAVKSVEVVSARAHRIDDSSQVGSLALVDRDVLKEDPTHKPRLIRPELNVAAERRVVRHNIPKDNILNRGVGARPDDEAVSLSDCRVLNEDIARGALDAEAVVPVAHVAIMHVHVSRRDIDAVGISGLLKAGRADGQVAEGVVFADAAAVGPVARQPAVRQCPQSPMSM